MLTTASCFLKIALRLHKESRGFSTQMYRYIDRWIAQAVGVVQPAEIAQLGERYTEDLTVPGSILGFGRAVWGGG